MWQGRTSQVAKLWGYIGGQQVGEIPAGAAVQGDPPRPDGYVFIRSPRVGFTKRMWIANYAEIIVTPPPPPPDTPTVTLTHEIEIFSNGSIKVDGISIP